MTPHIFRKLEEGYHVGAPVLSCEVKLVDLPEMGYSNDDRPFPRGEICVRGPSVFKGYYKNPDETRACLDEAGWLHTGDVGAWIEGGRLKIIDRKKNIFKLSQGEYIAAEKIEMAVSKSKYISQPWVYGNSFFPMLVAVVTPDFATLDSAAKAGGWYVENPMAFP